MDHATLRHRLATPGGACPEVGLGGFTLGGGIGRLSRRFGLACDQLLQAELVTADGNIVNASPLENPDLFWAIRGGGGNFGVVTALRMRLHGISPTVLAGRLVWPAGRCRDALRAYAELSNDAPDELNLDASLAHSSNGEPLFTVEACWSGAAAAGERVLHALRGTASPLVDTVGPTEYLQLQARLTTSGDAENLYYGKAGFLEGFPLEAIDVLLDAFRSASPSRVTANFQHCGGAMGRVAGDATAFPNRAATHWLTLAARAADPEQMSSRSAAARAAWQSILPYTRGLYVNSVMDEDRASIRANYGGNYARLAEIKRRCDPRNLFRLNANIAAG